MQTARASDYFKKVTAFTDLEVTFEILVQRVVGLVLVN